VKHLRSLLLVLAAALFMSAPASAADSITPELKINRSQGDSCVEPTDVMRKDHMKFLLHQRDETMYNGIRTRKYSLKECINCHANKDESGEYIPVTAEGEFCQSCHSYASVKLDCFECHATKPRDTAFHPIVTDKLRATRDMHEAPEAKKLLNDMLANKQPKGEAE
jgi:hypothetical protein